MKERNRIFVMLGVILLAAATYYWFTTDHTKEIAYTGLVDANQVIVNARIQGRIERLNVDEGQDVKAGDVIAVLDTAELNAQKQAAAATIASLRSQVAASRSTEAGTRGETNSAVQNAQAQIQTAKSELDASQADLVRLQQDDQRIATLAKEGVASQQDRDRSQQAVRAQQARVASLQDQIKAAQAAYEMAIARTNQARTAASTDASTQSQAQSAEAQLEQVEARLGYTRIVSPVNGTISVRVARQGEVINAGEAIVTIVDFSETWVRAAIPETVATRIGVGDSLRVRMPNGDIVNGKVIAKSAEADFATQRDINNKKRDIRTIALKLLIENPGKRYVPGMTADLLVPRNLGEATEAKK